MIVYHGCRAWFDHPSTARQRALAPKFLAGDFTDVTGWGDLYVTDTFERAARYANAQATRTVSAEYQELQHGAVVVVIDTDEAVQWRTRDASHPTLDTCESTIRAGRIVDIVRSTL